MLNEIRGIPGRDLVVDCLEKQIAQSVQKKRPLGVLLVRVQNFQQLHSEQDYYLGEAALQMLCAHIKELLSPTDQLIRTGEFDITLILPALAHADYALLVAEKIIACTEKPLTVHFRKIALLLNIGISIAPTHALGAVSLLHYAELALTQTQTTQAAYALYANQGQSVVACQLPLEDALKQAIDEDEIKLCYQPKIDLRSRELASVEALVRWTRRDGESISPERFVGVAERSGLILPLTLCTLNIALQDYQEIQVTELRNFSIAVNLSATLLDNPEIVALITEAMSIWGSTHRDLVLEVTESAMMTEPTASLRTLKHLSSMGIKLSIDDFGTGYSSLSHLAQFPVSELKIDQSFVRGMIAKESDAKIVRTIINLAHSLDLTVVAEGIEDAITLEALAALGCDFGQGYYMGRPMAKTQLMQWIETSPWS